MDMIQKIKAPCSVHSGYNCATCNATGCTACLSGHVLNATTHKCDVVAPTPPPTPLPTLPPVPTLPPAPTPAACADTLCVNCTGGNCTQCIDGYSPDSDDGTRCKYDGTSSTKDKNLAIGLGGAALGLAVMALGFGARAFYLQRQPARNTQPGIEMQKVKSDAAAPPATSATQGGAGAGEQQPIGDVNTSQQGLRRLRHTTYVPISGSGGLTF